MPPNEPGSILGGIILASPPDGGDSSSENTVPHVSPPSLVFIILRWSLEFPHVTIKATFLLLGSEYNSDSLLLPTADDVVKFSLNTPLVVQYPANKLPPICLV